MTAPPNITAAHRLAQDLILERVTIEVAQKRIYDLSGQNFDAVVEATHGALQTVAERLREEGRPLGGWTGA